MINRTWISTYNRGWCCRESCLLYCLFEFFGERWITWKAVDRIHYFQGVFPDIWIPCPFGVYSHGIACSFIYSILMACTLTPIAVVSRAVALYSAATYLIWFKVVLPPPLASCSCHLVSSLCSFCVTQWLCSCATSWANTAGGEFARAFTYCLNCHQINAYFSGEIHLWRLLGSLYNLWHLFWRGKK